MISNYNAAISEYRSDLDAHVTINVTSQDWSLMPHIEVQFEYEINKEEKKCIMHQAGYLSALKTCPCFPKHDVNELFESI